MTPNDDHAGARSAGEPVDAELISRRSERGVRSLVLAGVSAVACGALFPGWNSAPPGEQQDGSPVILVCAVLLMLTMAFLGDGVHQRKTVDLLRGATWRTSTCTLSSAGAGKSRRQIVHLEDLGRSYSRWCTMSELSSSSDHGLVEWAGDPDHHVVIRQPGSSRMIVHRALWNRTGPGRPRRAGGSFPPPAAPNGKHIRST